MIAATPRRTLIFMKMESQRGLKWKEIGIESAKVSELGLDLALALRDIACALAEVQKTAVQTR